MQVAPNDFADLEDCYPRISTHIFKHPTLWVC